MGQEGQHRGIEWDHHSFAAVQQFEGNYVEYVELPEIEEGVLTFAAEVHNGVSLSSEESLGVAIYHAPVPQSYDEARELWETARAASEKGVERPVSVVFIVESEWTVQGSTFAVRADISAVIDRHGPEVYTIEVTAEVGRESIVLSQYSMFH